MVSLDNVPASSKLLEYDAVKRSKAHLMLWISSLPGHHVPAATKLPPPGLTETRIKSADEPRTNISYNTYSS